MVTDHSGILSQGRVWGLDVGLHLGLDARLEALPGTRYRLQVGLKHKYAPHVEMYENYNEISSFVPLT